MVSTIKDYFKKCKNRMLIKGNEKGAISILSVVLLAIIIGFLFFLIFDYSTYIQKKQQLQNFADNAASAIAMQGKTISYPVDVIKKDCIDEKGYVYNCDYVLEDSSIIFDNDTKLNEKIDGIAHKIARKEFKLDENFKPTNGDRVVKTFTMEVQILDRINSKTEIRTEIGTYVVNNPTVVVKIWSTIEGPFLKKDLETITVGVFESKKQ